MSDFRDPTGTFRAIFRAADGSLLGLDFFGDSKALAIDHANYVAFADEKKRGLTVVKVSKIPKADFLHGVAGSWYRVTSAVSLYRAPYSGRSRRVTHYSPRGVIK
jgi:hypothetical protein